MRHGKTTATTNCLGLWMLPVCAVLLGTVCGRTSLLAVCSIEVTPTALDFGEVASGDRATLSVDVANSGGANCRMSSVELDPSSDPWFALGLHPSPSLVLDPGEHATWSVTFSPAGVSVPLQRLGSLVLQSNDPIRQRVEVPLTARIQTNCRIGFRPRAVDFGHVPIDSTSNFQVVVANNGTSPCEIAGIAIGQGSDPQFALDPGQSDRFSLAPGAEQSIVLAFHATAAAAPHHRTGSLVFASTDATQATVTIPLSADIDIGCALTITPSNLDFGKLILNTTTSRAITLTNEGSDTCQVSGIDFGPGTDPGFALGLGQARGFAVAPGSAAVISVNFGAFDSAPPHIRTGTLVLQTSNPRAPKASIPLSATVSTPCVEASRWIYTVDENGTFSRFDPATLSFTDIATLACPSPPDEYPFSMAVDQNAVAWVVYSDGNLYRVDTETGQCQATSFETNQNGFRTFGMGFVFEPSTGLDTLYIAGGDGPDTELATVSFPSLVVTPIGIVTAGEAELTGTGDGGLWGFVPSAGNPDGPQTVLVRLDPASGGTLESYSYPTLFGGYSWAVKFWSGSFWIFLDGSVYEVPRATPQTIRTAIAQTSRDIVGAGVSTCAPLF